LLLALGDSRGRTLRESLRLASPLNLVLALLLPALVILASPLATYLRDRILWAAFEFGKSFPPDFRSYFGSQRSSQLARFFPALVEEIGWRGYLQPRLIRGYGLYRGVFLVGIVWAAFHFSSDFSWSYTTLKILMWLATP